MRVLRFLIPVIALLTFGCPVVVNVNQDAGPGPGGSDAGPDGGSDAGPSLTCGLEFSYQNGYPCNSDSDCAGHHCAFALPDQVLSPGVCTSTCDDDGATDECMAGYGCTDAYSVSFEGPTVLSYGLYCMPQAGTGTLPGNASLPLGSPCRAASDCAGTGAICGAVSYGAYYFTFCAPTCDGTDSSCGGCGTCSNVISSAQDYCLFTGAASIGAPCIHNEDCASFQCDTFCTANCAQSACPSGSLCEAFTQNGESGALCIAPDQLGGTPDGDACLLDFQCAATSQCVENNLGATVCTPIGRPGDACASSTSCASGLNCVQVGPSLSECSDSCGSACPTGQSCFAPDIDTDLRLYNSIANGDDGDVIEVNSAYEGTGPWSTISSYAVTPGNWWVSVRADPGNFMGGYQLLITDGSGTPTPWQELPDTPVTHNSLATAQQIPFPVLLNGTLSSDSDVDDYEFTIPSATTITIQTLPGTPTACLPAAQVGGTALGDACTESFNCISGLTCDPTLQICTESCAADAGVCGSESCEPAGANNVCAPTTSVGGSADGASCSYPWQCPAGEDCVQSGSQSLCAAPCGSGMSCATSGRVCSPAIGSDSDSVQACLPVGSQSVPFGAACTIQSDCASGLTCTSGTCGKSCTTSADCPFQSGFTPDPLVCKTCQTDGDCTTETEEGSCIVVDPNENHCVFPCASNGDCPNGFTCAPRYSGFSLLNLCVPADGSCHAPVCASSACNVPPAGYAEACETNADCASGLCSGGLCSTSCTSVADCQCPTGDFACSSNTCGLISSYLRAGGGSTYATAQSLGVTLPVTVESTFTSGSTVAFYSMNFTGGAVVDFVTRPICDVADTAASTNLVLYGPSGNIVQSSEYTYTYADLHDVAIATEGTYTIEVQSTASISSGAVPFLLTISPKD